MVPDTFPNSLDDCISPFLSSRRGATQVLQYSPNWPSLLPAHNPLTPAHTKWFVIFPVPLLGPLLGINLSGSYSGYVFCQQSTGSTSMSIAMATIHSFWNSHASHVGLCAQGQSQAETLEMGGYGSYTISPLTLALLVNRERSSEKPFGDPLCWSGSTSRPVTGVRAEDKRVDDPLGTDSKLTRRQSTRPVMSSCDWSRPVPFRRKRILLRSRTLGECGLRKYGVEYMRLA
ncbi:unnamed protein product [Protopolystoma xenopodis]|uniref:Uncharacterized protein n=1 Tax=Protopolystoma xenopodis TaxID=117903 RepID=A0A3S5BPY8_9PLAT|nr:unnamed protein product [Protopolystoma xenopodis]